MGYDSEESSVDNAMKDSIASVLITRIKRGIYAPGHRLVEADLMNDFSVGRSQIRETLKTLVGEGYLTFVKNRGVFVRRFTRREALERGRVREVLEGLVARQVAERPLPSALKEKLRSIQSQLDDAANAFDIDTYAQCNEQFHQFILHHADNSFATSILEKLSMPVFRFQFSRIYTIKGMFDRNIDHQAVTAAILEEDGDAAEQAMRAHIRHGIDAMAKLTDDDFA